MTAGIRGWVLWAGTVGFEGSLADRFAAAAACVYRRVSVSPPEILRALGQGTPALTIRAMARGHGLELLVDPVMNWYPDRTTSPSRFAGVSTDDALRVCEAIGAVSMSAIGTGASDLPIAGLAERFATLCDRAAEFGADVHLEFIPFTVIRELRIAWDIVRAAGRPNGGLVVDSWHFFRGRPDLALLARIPGERIFQVQLDDAAARPSGTLREETQQRLLPGDGAFDLDRLVRVLAAGGGLRWVGPEVISPALAVLPATEAARLALDRTKKVVEHALAATA